MMKLFHSPNNLRQVCRQFFFRDVLVLNTTVSSGVARTKFRCIHSLSSSTQQGYLRLTHRSCLQSFTPLTDPKGSLTGNFTALTQQGYLRLTQSKSIISFQKFNFNNKTRSISSITQNLEREIQITKKYEEIMQLQLTEKIIDSIDNFIDEFLILYLGRFANYHSKKQTELQFNTRKKTDTEIKQFEQFKELLSDEFKKNELFETQMPITGSFTASTHIADELLSYAKEEVLDYNYICRYFIPTLFFEERELVEKVIEKNGIYLQLLAPYLRDLEICITAMKSSREAIHHIPFYLFTDNVLKGVQETKFMELVDAIIDRIFFKDGSILMYQTLHDPFLLLKEKTKKLPKEKRIFIDSIIELVYRRAVQKNGLFLQSIAYRCRDIVATLLAVEENGLALEFAKYEFQINPTVIDIAIQNNSMALKCVPLEARTVKVCVAAFKNRKHTLKSITMQELLELVPANIKQKVINEINIT